MKRNFTLLFLILAVACGVSKNPSRPTTQNQDASASLQKMDAKLVADVEKYIQLNKLGTTEFNTSVMRPVIAVSQIELARLKAAWAKTGAEHDVLARRFAGIDEAIKRGVTFPPEGGQHNQ